MFTTMVGVGGVIGDDGLEAAVADEAWFNSLRGE